MTDQPPKVIQVRCKHCAGLTLMQAPPEPDTAAIVAKALREFVAWLTRSAQDPARIGVRVQQCELAMRDEEERGEMLRFAQRQGVSEARVSKGVSDARDALAELQKVNFTHSDEKI